MDRAHRRKQGKPGRKPRQHPGSREEEESLERELLQLLPLGEDGAAAPRWVEDLRALVAAAKSLGEEDLALRVSAAYEAYMRYLAGLPLLPPRRDVARELARSGAGEDESDEAARRAAAEARGLAVLTCDPGELLRAVKERAGGRSLAPDG